MHRMISEKRIHKSLLGNYSPVHATTLISRLLPPSCFLCLRIHCRPKTWLTLTVILASAINHKSLINSFLEESVAKIL